MTPGRLSLLLLLAVCAGVLVSGCSLLPRPVTDPDRDTVAEYTATRVRSMNRQIQSSKGSGQLRIFSGDMIQTLGMAWAVQAPHQARIIFMISGNPAATLISDGQVMTVISHTGQRTSHTVESSDPGLESFLNVPIRLSDILSILMGQIPIKKYSDAWFAEPDPDAGPDFATIRMSRTFQTRVQELIMDPDGVPAVLRLLNRKGWTVFEIRYERFRTFDHIRIPSDMTLTDGKDRKIHLSISRFYPDAAISDQTFRLTVPGS